MATARPLNFTSGSSLIPIDALTVAGPPARTCSVVNGYEVKAGAGGVEEYASIKSTHIELGPRAMWAV